jgi:hypothetical protein
VAGPFGRFLILIGFPLKEAFIRAIVVGLIALVKAGNLHSIPWGQSAPELSGALFRRFGHKTSAKRQPPAVCLVAGIVVIQSGFQRGRQR